MIWNKKIECMSRDEMHALQSEKLVKIVAHAYNNSPFYKKRFDEHGVRPEDIRSIDDIVKLPFTVKKDLRDNYPFGMMCVPMTQILRLHASSGTTGKPIVVGYVRKTWITGPKPWHAALQHTDLAMTIWFRLHMATDSLPAALALMTEFKRLAPQ